MIESFDQRIKESARGYQAEPKLTWKTIESRLQESGKKKVRRLYTRIVSAAAFVLLVGVFITNQYFFIFSHQNTLFVSADSISELDSKESYYYYGGRYAAKDLYRAYYKSGALQEEEALNGLR